MAEQTTAQKPGQAVHLSSTDDVNHLFKPMYQVLLALHTVSQSQHVKLAVPALREQIQQPSARLTSVSWHPVLAAMLLSTTSPCADASSTQVGTLMLHAMNGNMYGLGLLMTKSRTFDFAV